MATRSTPGSPRSGGTRPDCPRSPRSQDQHGVCAAKIGIMTTPRGAMIQLLNSHPWTIPQSTAEAVQFHASLPLLLRAAHGLHGDDRIAKLVVLRLDVFLAHWPHPPHAGNSDRFVRDAEGLAAHDVPRLRETLQWAPAELPQQRAPRLGAASLDTA